MNDSRIDKFECAIEILIKKGIIIQEEIREEYNKKLQDRVDSDKGEYSHR